MIVIESIFKRYPDVLNMQQLQEALGIGRTLAYKLVNLGEIKSLKVGKYYKIPKKYLIDYIYKNDDPENNLCYNIIDFESGLPSERRHSYDR